MSLPAEFSLIARHFRPLAGPGALDLRDDAALLTPPPGRELVLTADAMVAGVHFLPDDPPDLVGRKLLRVNLSDLAAKGAVPLGYLMTVSTPKDTPEAWFAGFAAGLAQDQAIYGVTLLGGDTTSTPGPISLSLTIIGHVAPGTAVHRSGARAGDEIWVTGTIGDGALGLAVALGGWPTRAGSCWTATGCRSRGSGWHWRASPPPAMDVSDGLVQDLGAYLSGERCWRRRSRSTPCRCRRRRGRRGRTGCATCLTGGDDYELLLAVPPARSEALRQAAAAVRHPCHPDRALPFRPARGHGASGQRRTSCSDKGGLEPLLAGNGRPRKMNKNVWLLFACQALMNAVMSGQTVMASLVGYKLSGTALNTLPMAIQMVAVMSASVVAGYAFPRFGRRGGFWLGCAIMMSGSLTFALGIYTGNFASIAWARSRRAWVSAYPSICASPRPRSPTPAAKARAISLVLAGGVLAAIVGPEMVKRTNALIPDYIFLATYLYLPVLPVITAVLLCFVRGAAGAEESSVFRCLSARSSPGPTSSPPLSVRWSGYGSMNLIMASTPLQMLLCGFGVAASADVIRAHSIAMFSPRGSSPGG